MLKSKGISYQLYNVNSYRKVPNPVPNALDSMVSLPDRTDIYRVDIEWLNIRSDVKTQGRVVSNDYVNYYTNENPVLNVRSYSEVLYENIYDGVNLLFKCADGHVKYDYIVKPFCDHKKIQFKIKGAQTISIDEKGSLIMETPIGTIVEGAPIVFQNGRKLSAAWKLNNNIVSFDIKEVKKEFPLIIDPVIFRQWGTYYGDIGYDVPNNVFSDKDGNVFMTGYTNSTGNIATVGSFQATCGGNNDGFIVKFDSMGVRQWATYFGGSGSESIGDALITKSNNLYVVGHTSTFGSTVIATPGCHQPNYNGGTWDAFLARFDGNGIRKWSTYYGGTGLEYGFSCSVDKNENIYFSGQTSSAGGTIIATPGSHQPAWAFGSGAFDCYLVKFDSSGTRIWGTYYGGPDNDSNGFCDTDNSGNVYLSGTTASSVGISTPATHQPTIGSAFSLDAFLAKFNSSGVRQWGTYYGGYGSDNSGRCGTDTLGNVYLSGITNETITSVFSTPGAHQTFNAGGQDGFLAKFDANSGLRQWGTFYGGSGTDYLFSFTPTPSGEIYLFGTTTSSVGISLVTPNAYQYNYGGGISDAFMAKLSPNCVRYWGSYYGGPVDENGYGGNYNDYGKVLLVGNTDDFVGTSIVTPGSHQPAGVGGPMDGLLIQFYNCNSVPVVTSNSVICTGQSATLSVSGASSYTWSTGSNSTSIVVSPTINTTYTLGYTGALTCSDTITFTQNVSVCTGINELDHEKAYAIYPNPVKDIMVVKCSSFSGKDEIYIYDALGKNILRLIPYEKETLINYQTFSEGLYFIRIINSGKEIYTSKFVKED